jgi:hypothetical protein
MRSELRFRSLSLKVWVLDLAWYFLVRGSCCVFVSTIFNDNFCCIKTNLNLSLVVVDTLKYEDFLRQNVDDFIITDQILKSHQDVWFTLPQNKSKRIIGKYF